MFLNLNELPTKQVSILNSLIGPRPIGLISTIDREGNANLAPFSFFNLVSYHPPVLIFSPVRRWKDASEKHTTNNIRETAEAVIHIVTADLLHQMNLCSCEYDTTVDEFVKAGFEKTASEKVKPYRIAGCAIAIECRITEVKPLGYEGGAGNLMIAKMLCVHINDRVLGPDGQIAPAQLQQVARLGGDWYTSMNARNLFELLRPKGIPMGFDNLPEHIRHSSVLSANQKALLASSEAVPELNEQFHDIGAAFILDRSFTGNIVKELHEIAAVFLDRKQVDKAWQVLLRVPAEAQRRQQYKKGEDISHVHLCQ